jgi:hypothetical protein
MLKTAQILSSPLPPATTVQSAVQSVMPAAAPPPIPFATPPDMSAAMIQSDWLDRLGAWCPDQPSDISTWCVGKLSAGAETLSQISSQFSPKIWIAVAALLLFAVSFRWLVEWFAVTLHVVKARLRATAEKRRKLAAERAHRIESARFEVMSDEGFAAITGRLKKRISRHEDQAAILDQSAQRAFGPLAWILRKSAKTHIVKAQSLSKEQDRLENLWLFTARRREEKRENENRTRARRQVLGLIHLLHATYEAYAQDALAELNKIRTSFDWDLLIPQSMPVTDRIRMHRLLQVMAGTSQLGEARNALVFVRHILEDHNFTWDKMAA